MFVTQTSETADGVKNPDTKYLCLFIPLQVQMRFVKGAESCFTLTVEIENVLSLEHSILKLK